MRVWSGVILAFLCSGCVTTETVAFRPKPQQEAMMRDGQAALVSKGRNSVVTIRPAKRDQRSGERPIFIVTIQNMSRGPLDFRTGLVTAVQVDNARDMKVVTYEELVAEERHAQVSRAIIGGLAAGAAGAAASGHGYWARANANYQSAQLAAATVAVGQQNLAALEALVIKDHTLMPGEVYGGRLVLDAPSQETAKAYSIAMMVGSDRHEVDVVHEKAR